VLGVADVVAAAPAHKPLALCSAGLMLVRSLSVSRAPTPDSICIHFTPDYTTYQERLAAQFPLTR